MRREQSIGEISDGRRYRADDLVKIGTNGCLGCCDCCRMDALIVLDPWDIYQLKKASGCGLEKLLNVTVRLEVIDGLIQPVLAMAGGACPYLGADGRCEIHAYRPGICRLYPLGRCWEDGDFSYILQVGECTHCTGSKVKVKKWLGIPDLSRYEAYCRTYRIIFGKLSACRSWKSAIWPDLTQRRTSTRSLRISFRRLAAPLGSAVFRDCNQAAASGSSSSVCGIAGWHFHIESWTEIPSAGRQEDAGRVILWYTLCSRSQSGIRRTSNCPARVREQDEVPQRREGRGKLSGTRAGQEAELCRADGEK